MSEENLNEENEIKLSALRENIEKKGNNSYYYAHGHRANGPEWDGKEEPRLLATAPVEVKSNPLSRPIDSYAWMDGKKLVKILIDFENASTIEDEKIHLEWTESSVNFRIHHSGEYHALTLSPFSATIESASIKKKDDQIVIQLKKEVESPWYDLLKKN
mmetsp:Transcript_11604/g.11987  ORF Transcript_11604/g.11987 Transcript_11604/m.11987 type:complete len:159 (+) Transcript_11604:54-530(+)